MSALVSITVTFSSGFRGAGITRRLDHLLHQPALARDIVGNTSAGSCALDAAEVRG